VDSYRGKSYYMCKTVLVFIASAFLPFWECGKSTPSDYGNNTPSSTVMRLIPGGTFQMGSTVYYAGEQPVHSVTVSAFYMDTTEVTQADYQALMGVNPSYFSDSLRPVETVTWFDAVLYCNARSIRDSLDAVYSYTSLTGTPGSGCSAFVGLAIDTAKSGYRLPTEAEWEYACRAGDMTDYYWGGTSPLTTAADTSAMDTNTVWSHNSGSQTAGVGTKLPNAYGLYDMSGNVWEWCNDWYLSNYYHYVYPVDPTGPETGSCRVFRGGSWVNNDFCQRSPYRGNDVPDYRDYYTGFRCVRRWR
jgi:formylglycine-generating enzyme required for sulfatase activity